jgi:hypothetical protein
MQEEDEEDTGAKTEATDSACCMQLEEMCSVMSVPALPAARVAPLRPLMNGGAAGDISHTVGAAHARNRSCVVCCLAHSLPCVCMCVWGNSSVFLVCCFRTSLFSISIYGSISASLCLCSGSKVSGQRCYFLTGIGVRLNLALVQYGLDFLTREELGKDKYTEISTPFFMSQEAMAKTAQLEQFDEELYTVLEMSRGSAGTSTCLPVVLEVSVCRSSSRPCTLWCHILYSVVVWFFGATYSVVCLHI